MPKALFSTLFSLFFIPFLAVSQTNDGWVFKNEKEGVKVYYRKTSSVYELKLVTSLKVNLSGLVLLLTEVDNYPKWGYKVLESKELKNVSDWETYYYSKLDFPWPLDDRDIVVRSTMTQDPVTRRITTSSVATPTFIPEEKGVVRLKDSRTSWTLVPGQGGWTYVEYYIYSDPGGNLPDWLVNMAIDVGPRETIKSMRNFISQEKYQKAKLPYIKD